jgi:2-oxoisovalerate dehydrogenase E2 component (dihydrolipoyl transacylase)
MALITIKVPDVGEGIAEAELAEWSVKLGDLIREDEVIAAVMTDKATIEIPSSAAGRVVWLGAEPGETIAIGAALIRIETEAGATPDPAEPAANPEPKVPEPTPAPEEKPAAPAPPSATLPPKTSEKPLASPAVRLRALEAGVDLRSLHGSGPAGRITHDDLDHFLASPTQSGPSGKTENHAVKEIKIIGLRRKIAERMSLANTRIPHITIVEELDVTALEDLRAQLNSDPSAAKPKLTLLPFLMAAMVKAIAQQPGLNAHFDDEAGILREYGAVHIGIATQTPGGLMVPVLRHCEARSIWNMAAELASQSGAAKSGSASRDALSGSTITITSLGALGAIATTPIINHPEVAIIGINRMAIRPMWNGTDFVPRKMMNLSSSFDHRVIDGYDAAVFVKRLKTLLETPAMIFIEE